MGKKKSVSYPKEYLTENSIITNLVEWKEFIKKNTWKKLYRQQDSKIDVIDSFCASFSHCSDQIMIQHERNRNDLTNPLLKRQKYQELAKAAEKISFTFSTSGVEISKGWKIHKHWFRCMVVQLVMFGAEDNEQFADRHQMLTDLFSELEWGNIKDYQNPTYDDITSTLKLPFTYRNSLGVLSTEHYTVLIEPTDMIPCGSKWVSAKGYIWQACDANDNGTINIETTGLDIYGHQTPYYRIQLTTQQIFGMKRMDY
jgi:hypothetical protein